jgi:integrase
MLKHAKRWGYLRDNPAQEIRHVRVEHQEMDFLKPDEIRLLLNHADEPFRALFLTAIMTGMRLGELLALQWGDIDWHSRVIRVKRSVFWYSKRELAEEGSDQPSMWKFTTPKSTRSCRAIAMSPHLKETLELHRLQCRVSPHDLVFCSQIGTPIQPRNLVRREFEPALVRAELRRIRFHDLRHTYTALLIAQGTHPKLIQSQLGHASIQTTLDRYGHLLPHMGEQVGHALDKQVFGPDRDGTPSLNSADVAATTNTSS